MIEDLLKFYGTDGWRDGAPSPELLEDGGKLAREFLEKRIPAEQAELRQILQNSVAEMMAALAELAVSTLLPKGEHRALKIGSALARIRKYEHALYERTWS